MDEDDEENREKEKEKKKKEKEKEKEKDKKGKKDEEEEIKPRCLVTTLNQDQWPLTHGLLKFLIFAVVVKYAHINLKIKYIQCHAKKIY